MDLDAITTEAVREALRATRYAKPLDASPLLGLSALATRVRGCYGARDRCPATPRNPGADRAVLQLPRAATRSSCTRPATARCSWLVPDRERRVERPRG